MEIYIYLMKLYCQKPPWRDRINNRDNRRAEREIRSETRNARREDWEKRRAKRGTGAQAKVQYHSPEIFKHHKIITSFLAQRQPRGGASAASEKFCRAKRGTQDKVQYHSPAISKHHEIITSILAQGQRRGGASAAS